MKRDLCIGFMIVLLSISSAQTPQLVQVSTLPASAALGISADGQHVVGGSLAWNANTPAFYWTPSRGERQLPLPAGARQAIARGVSDDGSVIVGEAYYNTGVTIRPVVWRAPDYQPTLLPLPSGYQEGIAMDVSGDGRLIVGRYTHTNRRYFAMWIDGVLNEPLSAIEGEFRRISRDGVPVGGFDVGGSVRWTPQRGFEVLGGIYATAASLSAHHVVGFTSNIGDGLMGSYWDSCGQISLGRFNDLQTELYALSDDGRIAAGTAGRGQFAIRWKRERGFLDGWENLNATFAPYLGGRVLGNVFDMSADGRYLVGTMGTPQGMRAFRLDTAGL
ncbi:MAG: hypothetical protein KatS3mg020_1024 [Fimbriimonadales bacterium]|nr:MAG: hypothetical protein KatS3mg020_1024 [Fimbriimonadales bacterium]